MSSNVCPECGPDAHDLGCSQTPQWVRDNFNRAEDERVSTFIMDEAVMVHPVNLHRAYIAALQEALVHRPVSFVPTDINRIRSAKTDRDAFRSRMASSKADLFDRLMGEC